MKNVTIFTTFRENDPAYSLNGVVLNQLKMLLAAGYKPKVIVAKGFEPSEEYAKVECIEIPDVTVFNEFYIDKTFEADVGMLMAALKPALENTDIMITHDLVYQPAALKHNVAIRRLLTERGVKDMPRFLHWIHSSTEPTMIRQIRGGGDKFLEVLKTPFPNSFYITFNTYSVSRLAGWFGIEESEVKYVPHPHDFYEGWHPDAIKIAEKAKLLEKDIIIIYPLRLDRGKQPEMVIKIGHAVKATGRSIGVVLVDFHSDGGDKLTYRQELKNLAIELEMSESEVVFAAEIDFKEQGENKLRVSFPHQVVSNLFEISNTFILPSKSETYSLVAQEAAIKRNFCILNFDFPPLRSVYGDAPHYLKFSSNLDVLTGQDGGTETKYTDEKQYWHDAATYINFVQEHTRVLALANKLRKERNLKTVFKKNIEPLFSAGDKFNY